MQRTIRVQSGDCDAQGIVRYSRYFEWFAAGRGTPLAVRLAVHEPLVAGDEAVAETVVADGALHYRLFRHGRLAVEACETPA